MIGIGTPIQILHPSHADRVLDRAQDPKKHFTVIRSGKPIKETVQHPIHSMLIHESATNNPIISRLKAISSISARSGTISVQWVSLIIL